MEKLIGSAALLAAALVVAIPHEAQACGGTFCDVGPNAMPVDQTGENILFLMAEDYTEAHIQIQYDPDTVAEQFAWLVPLTEVPEFGIGSELFFDALLNQTVPSYGFTSTFIGLECSDDGSGGGSDPTSPGSFTSGGEGSSGGGETGGDTDGGPEILLNEIVGAFEITVLTGDSVEEVRIWLDANGYAQDPNADPILEEYLSEGYVFAAFKLTNEAETSEIHPITLRFSNNEACIPLRLTRIAAVDDMNIRSFFLADNRVVPETYRHVVVNPLKLDWPNLASNYASVITQAVDADQADGRAFVTEYAGRSSIVPTAGLYSEAWDSSGFSALAVTGVVEALDGMGLMTCFEDGGGTGTTGTTTGGPVDTSQCQYNHPLLRGLLQRYLPVPDGIEEVAFYGCLSCYEGSIDMMAWDGALFAADLEERIIVPGRNARDALQAFPTLTRMYTTMSPGEMTADPMFYQNPDLAEVDNTNQLAVRGTGCTSASIWTLPDGREVYTPSSSWPDFEDEMPWEEEVAEMAPAGAPMVLVNRTESINTQLAEHNCMFNYPSSEACGAGTDTDTGTGTGSGTGNDTDSGASSYTGSQTSASPSGTGTDTDGPGGALDDDGGCSCSTAPSGSGAWWLGLLGLLGLGRTRRRSHSTT